MSQSTRWIRLGVWVVAAAAVLAIGFAVLGVTLIGLEISRREEGVGDIQWLVWMELYRVVLMQALLPQLAATAVVHTVIARLAPALDATWPRTVGALALSAVIGFPVVWMWTFVAWNPTSARDVIATAALVGGAAAFALLLTRRIARAPAGSTAAALIPEPQ